MIEFRNLKKTFDGHAVLQGISLSIQTGETVAVVGRSGEGKSVLLQHLVGLITATSGEIYLDGNEITHCSEEEFFVIRRKCGYVFQLPALFDFLDVFENVTFGLKDHLPRERREKAKEVLSLVNLHGIEHKYPHQLSFGMQKRVSLARALALSPQYLLYDEPTTGLDPINTGMINELIMDLQRELKVTSVVVTHDMESACLVSDRIALLSEGKIVEIGSPEEIRASHHPLAKEFMLELKE
ncbi:MAG TPA: ATP-binding cassette domain-containing protein [Bdellovibrionota bacterium]|nr:ATP-binding cassette domain-containing protein [Bdellovibrionota bacterium]